MRERQEFCVTCAQAGKRPSNTMLAGLGEAHSDRASLVEKLEYHSSFPGFVSSSASAQITGTFLGARPERPSPPAPGLCDAAPTPARGRAERPPRGRHTWARSERREYRVRVVAAVVPAERSLVAISTRSAPSWRHWLRVVRRPVARLARARHATVRFRSSQRAVGRRWGAGGTAPARFWARLSPLPSTSPNRTAHARSAKLSAFAPVPTTYTERPSVLNDPLRGLPWYYSAASTRVPAEPIVSARIRRLPDYQPGQSEHGTAPVRHAPG
jgi:hypothetical protein